MRYNNYHRHSHYSNFSSPDCNVKMIDYINRAIELGEKNVFTTEHGSMGSIFEAVSLCKQYGLNCKAGLEGYIVSKPMEKDKSNYHIVCIPVTNIARKKLNKANSRAHKEGYYYKPRLFLDDLINNFGKDELIITSACVGGLLKDDNSINEILIPLYKHFENNLFLEVQASDHELQKTINNKALKLHEKYGIKLISATDSHYIYPNQKTERLELLKGKGITYDEEDSFDLDYPDYNTIFKRYQRQGVLNDEQIKEALNNTLVFDKCENIEIDMSVKMPTIYPNLDDDEKIKLLKNIATKNFKQIIREENISEEKKDKYIKEIKSELQVIEDTKEIHTADYFLFNIKMIERAVNEYDGVLTRTGRGSYSAFLLNKILGLTQIDRLTVDLPIYSDRFASSSRLLENLSLPDMDFNTASQEPFIKATRDLLGEKNCYPMIAYGTMKESEAFRNVCRSHGLEFSEFNEVGKNIDNYREHEKWKAYIEETQTYVSTIISASIHPCSFLLMNDDIEEEVGVVKIGEHICAMITSSEADEYRYLKNDLLTVSVWDIIDKTFKLIKRPILTINELTNSLDDRVWELFEKGLTCTLNQVDSDWATNMVKTYKPKSVEELSMYVASIRPSFEGFRYDFLHRKPYTTGSEQLDKVLYQTEGRILFQENLMRYFEWLGITPSESIGIIKKISKKKIKPDAFEQLEERIKKQWVVNTGSIDKFDDTWDMVQSCISYGFASPHAVAVALDCLYGAYLKVNYSIEYYTVVLNMYQNDKEKTLRLLNEMKEFNLTLSDIKFRKSSDVYTFDKPTNTIYKSISSIKNIGKSNGEDLYSLKDNTYNTFTELLLDIKQTSVNSKQLDILIKLNFFEEFGDINYLLETTKWFELYHKSKTLSKAKLTEYETECLQSCYSKETEKQYKEIDNDKFIHNLISRNPPPPISAEEQMRYQIELLGYTNITDPKSTYYAVTDVQTNSYGTPFVNLYRIKDGKSNQFKADKKYYTKHKLKAGNIIRASFIKKNKKRKTETGWTDTGEVENILSVWSIQGTEQDEIIKDENVFHYI